MFNLRLSRYCKFIFLENIIKSNLGQGEIFKAKNKKTSRRGSRSLDNTEFGHFTLFVVL